jgi:uncharacterized membrane-anchored protein
MDNMEHKKLFYLMVGLQVVFLLCMIGMKHSTVVFGKKILLKPIPVDPTDPFRGDYVTIQYDISTIDESKLPEGTQGGDTLYVSLENKGKYWGVSSVDRVRHGTVEIKGVVTSIYDGKARISYPVDTYYVPKKQGLREELREFDKLLIEIAVWRGDAIVTNIMYDGSPLEFSDEWRNEYNTYT